MFVVKIELTLFIYIFYEIVQNIKGEDKGSFKVIWQGVNVVI